MEQLNKNILLETNNMLASRPFSDDVKEKIRNAIVNAYNCYTKTKDKEEHFKDIINSIKEVNTFKVNTRKQLNKIEEISSHLDDCTLGYVSDDRKVVVVVKHNEEERAIYHELIHLTQPENAYYVDEKYPFSKFISKCLLEGEATFYDIDLYDDERLSYEMVDTFGDVPNFVTSKGNYPFFYLIYRVMIEIFGDDLVEEWRNCKYDIIPKLKEVFEGKYGRSFSDFYMCITKMIYQYFKNNKDYSFLLYDLRHTIYEIADKNFEFQQNKEKLRDISENFDSFNKELKEYSKLLEDEGELKKSFKQIVESVMKDPGEDEDLSKLTIENYKKHILSEIKICTEEKARLNIEYEQLGERILEQQTDYYCLMDHNFYDDGSKNSFVCYEAILMVINKNIEDVKLGHLKERTK